MTEARRLDAMPDLERRLTELRQHVVFPPTPDLAASIRAQIAAQPARPSRTWSPRPIWQPRRLAIAFVVLLLAGAGILAAVPDLRTAVADRLGLDGIRIEFVDDTPTPSASPIGATLLLGERMTLEEAQARVPYVIQIPAALGSPDEIYVRQLSAGPMVSLLYLPRPGLPESSESGVGAILMQFPADSRPSDLAKRITRDMGSVIDVNVGGAEGYWITGASEFVITLDPSEGFEDIIGRPSANVLLWQTADMTYRLETDLLQRDAISIAESLEPSPLATPGTDSAP